MAFIQKLISIVLSIFGMLSICRGESGLIFPTFTPTLTADFSTSDDEISSGASGYLYGIAQPGVPSSNMTESIDISSASQKAAGGLQHPIGDVDDVYTQLESTEYIVVYLQDMYDTWYYMDDEITELRSKGEYDWETFITEDYLPKVRENVEYMKSVPYSDKVVYCLYNECDNGVWFGTTVENPYSEFGVSGSYDEGGRQNFYKGWLMTYNAVKEINPNAIIGGPGFYEYSIDKISDFLNFCKANDCLPDIMIYHELADDSVYYWQHNVAEYRSFEESIDIEPLPIIVTEYGRMQDCGIPGKMVQYITQIEGSGVLGNMAYWRLANNLCDVAADDNSPNSNWWLFRWYADMEGKKADITYSDLMNSNFAKALKTDAPFSSKGFMGVASFDEENEKIEVICGGGDSKSVVKLKGLSDTAFENCDVLVTIESTVYKGLSGIVNEPTAIKAYKAKIRSGKLNILLDTVNEGNAYHITVTPLTEGDEERTNTGLPQRFEAESGQLLGGAYTYRSAYAATGGEENLVGGMENPGDGVAISFTVPDGGDYDIDIIYGKSNDGSDKDDRIAAKVNLTLDSANDIITLDNTIKSEYTSCYNYSANLTEGEHTLTLTHNEGTYVIDSIVVTPKNDRENIYIFKDGDRTTDTLTSFLAVAPDDGYYALTMSRSADLVINGVSASATAQGTSIYLQRGLNYIDFKGGDMAIQLAKSTASATREYTAEAASLVSPAVLAPSADGTDHIEGIYSGGGSATFSVEAPSAGTYFMTFTYANNDEGGVHDYNVDLIERYVTVRVNGKAKDVYCRSTYSLDTYKTVTCSVELAEGENTLVLENSGNNKFNGGDTYAPLIKSFTLSSPTA